MVDKFIQRNVNLKLFPNFRKIYGGVFIAKTLYIITKMLKNW